MVFSDSTNNLGGVQQTRSLMRVDANQWPTSKIVNSFNNYLDEVAGYAIGADRRFNWDDTNHSRLPEGTLDITASVSDYSFLTDQNGNRVLTLLRIDRTDPSGDIEQLIPIDQSQTGSALAELFPTTGTPKYYDKIADNIVRLYPTPDTSVTAGLKFYFQRAPSYFTASDTTKEPGVAPILHRGFVIAAAYDGALALGLPNLPFLAVEMEKEREKMKDYFLNRNNDQKLTLTTLGSREEFN
jgi:hypothetical protein